HDAISGTARGHEHLVKKWQGRGGRWPLALRPQERSVRHKLLTAEHLANTGHVVRLSAARPARKKLVSRVNSLNRRDNRTCPNFRSRLCLPLSVRMKAAIEGAPLLLSEKEFSVRLDQAIARSGGMTPRLRDPQPRAVEARVQANRQNN